MDSDKSISVAFTFFDGHGRGSEDWLEFPATAEKLRQMLERSNFVTAECHMAPMFWENETASPVGGLTELPFYEGNVNELNYLSAKLSELDGEDLAKFEAVIESGRHLGTAGVGIGDMADYINIAENLDNFTFHSDMGESGYGEYLLSGPDSKIADIMRLLHNYYGQEGEELGNIVDCLRECADAEQFGRSMAYNNDGEFLSSGYLIEEGGFRELYRDTKDIPDEYRIWEPPDTFIKVVDVDLRGLLMEMHALGGNYSIPPSGIYAMFCRSGLTPKSCRRLPNGKRSAPLKSPKETRCIGSIIHSKMKPKRLNRLSGASLKLCSRNLGNTKSGCAKPRIRDRASQDAGPLRTGQIGLFAAHIFINTYAVKVALSHSVISSPP